MDLLDRISKSRQDDRVAEAQRGEKRFAIDQWLNDYLLPANQFVYGQTNYPFGINQTLMPERAREISASLPGYMAALRTCPPAFAAQMVRATVLSQARFIFRSRAYTASGSQRSNPRKTFGTRDLRILEKPWTNATTGELLTRMEWHAGVAGNAYVTNHTPGRLRVLRPDWVVIVFGSDQEPDDAAYALDGEVIAYAYMNGGFAARRNDIRVLSPDEVAHWSPLPDPEFAGIGMSWLTPAVRDIQGDQAMTDHKLRFFANSAPQPLSARVLTPTGWATMGEMRVGSEVIGSDGKPHMVTAVYPQGVRDIYRVDFAGGTSAECTLDHVWQVTDHHDRQRGASRLMTLSSLIDEGFSSRSGSLKWAVPLVDPVEYYSSDLPLDPYFLGLLLGARQDTDETMELLRSVLPVNVAGSRRSTGEITAHEANELTGIIKTLGLFGLSGRQKFIPEPYLRASPKDRVALLQGLVDSDGHIGRTSVAYTTVSRRLAEDLTDLVGSLGGIATVMPVRGRDQYSVVIRQLPRWVVPARLSRKATAYERRMDSRKRASHRTRTIVGAELVRQEAAQCIAVDSDDHLYVTDDFILTHNTPNMVVKGIPAADREQFNEIVDQMEARHTGVRNAYRTLYLAAGADATVVGKDFRQMDFRAVQSFGETRISTLSRVHPVILGLFEGLSGSSLNAGNFAAARRIFADFWIYPTLQDIAASLSPLINVPADAELWFDTSDMPILREDARDAAEIQSTLATTIVKYVVEGFTPESSIAAVMAQNPQLLEHTGLLSVQLQPPGGFDVNAMPPPGGEQAPPKPAPTTAPKPAPPRPAPPTKAKG